MRVGVVVTSSIIVLRTGVTGRAELHTRNGSSTPWRYTEKRKELGEHQSKDLGFQL